MCDNNTHALKLKQDIMIFVKAYVTCSLQRHWTSRVHLNNNMKSICTSTHQAPITSKIASLFFLYTWEPA